VEANRQAEVKGKLISKKVSDVGFTVEGNCTGSATNLSVEAAYSNAPACVTAKVTHNAVKKETIASLAAMVGYDGIAVGGHVDVNANNPGSPTEYNIGAECVQKDLQVTVATSNKLNDITVSYFQTVSPRLVLASSLAVKGDASREFTFGGEYEVEKPTKLKFKADTKGVVAASVTHTLSDPAVKILAAAEFNTQSADVFAPQQLGLSLSFGDF